MRSKAWWPFEIPLILLPHMAVVIWPGWIWLTCTIFVLSMILTHFLTRRARVKVDPESTSMIPHVTAMRSTNLLQTCICILAYDFPSIFQSRFAKNAVFGSSLMEIGIGIIIYTGGVVAGKLMSDRPIRAWPMFRITAVLILLGLARIVVLWLMGARDSEYGFHWNSFFTIAFLGPLVYGLLMLHRLVFKNKHYWINKAATLLMLLLYQLALSFGGLQEYLLSENSRVTLFEQNKEGIFSMIGYLNIFVLAAYTGHWLMVRETVDEGLAPFLVINIIFSLVPYGLMKIAGLEPSRRLANLSYVLWIHGFGSLHHLLGWLTLPKDKYAGMMPVHSEGFSSHQLILFLMANLLTGLIKNVVDTRNATAEVALGWMFLYGVVLFLAAVGSSYLFRGDKDFSKIVSREKNTLKSTKPIENV